MLPGLRLPCVALLGVSLLAIAAGCGGEGEGGGDPAAGTEASRAAPDGEGMEPRIVVEHPVDAPGRPAEGAVAPIAPPESAAWVPHLEVADLDASLAFYLGHGFTVVSRAADDGAPRRAELERDGAGLALVVREAREADGTEPAGEGDEPAPPGNAPPVLHLVGAGGGTAETVTDPDGHRLALPGGR